jgi:hypothetical protein
MGYDSKGLQLCGQPIAGAKSWQYDDTGGETLATYEGSGFIEDAKNYGVTVGDSITVIDRNADLVYRGQFTVVQDTGGTTGTIALANDTGGVL